MVKLYVLYYPQTCTFSDEIRNKKSYEIHFAPDDSCVIL